MMKKAIENLIQEAVKKAGYKTDAVEVFYPEEDKFGDFSTNIALKLAKDINKNPKEVAEKIVTKIKTEAVEKVEIAGPGFINLFVTPTFWQDQLSEIIKQDNRYGRQNIGKGKKVQVEFISANPTGPLTLGNGRGGYGGDALANVLGFLGYNVTREYYVNDSGNQIKKLGETLLFMTEMGKKNSKAELNEAEYLKTLLEIYKDDKEFLKWTEAKDPVVYGKKVAQDILNQHIKKTVKDMGIKFDVWFQESDLYKKGEVEKVLETLKKKQLTYEKEGAIWFKTSQFGDTEDRVIIKSDGTYTYIVPDIAYHYDKFAVRKFDKVINIWGTDHHGYVARIQAAVEALGYKENLDVILMQLVRLIKQGKEYKTSKRKGLYITIEDLFDLIGGPDASDVARFFYLSYTFNSHMDFDLDLAKERSEKNPVFYVKYAHARLAGILRKQITLLRKASDGQAVNRKQINLNLLVQKEEIALIKILSQLPEVAAEIASDSKYPVHKLTHYSIEIARKLHSFYDKCRVINEKNLELTAARLELVKAAKIVLKIVGEDLIGIKMPEKM